MADDSLTSTADPTINLTGSRTVQGTSLTDILTGTNADDVFFTRRGVDVVFGSAGNDIIDVGEGNDFAFGGSGNTTIIGGLGDDNLFGDAGDNLLLGGGGGDSLFGGTETDLIYGGVGADIIQGGSGTNTLIGGAGIDSIIGGADTDHVYIDLAEENFLGESINGGGGDDTLFLLFDTFAAFNQFDAQVQSTGSNEAALAGLGFTLLSIETIEVVPVGLAPELNNVAFTASEDDGTLRLELAEAIVNAVGDVFSIGNVTASDPGLDFQIDGTDLLLDANLFNALSQGQTANLTFDFEIRDELGLIGNAQAGLTVTGVNDDVTINDDASNLSVVTNLSSGVGVPTQALVTFDGVSVGPSQPFVENGIRIESFGSLSEEIVDTSVLGFDQVDGVLAGTAFAFEQNAPGTISFDQPVEFVSFGFVGLNEAGSTITVFGNQDAAIEQFTIGVDLPANLGQTPALVSITAPPGTAIEEIQIDPVGNDRAIVDNIVFGDAISSSSDQVSGFVSFDEFPDGTEDPLTDGFVTISTQADNFVVREPQFTQFPGVFEGQWLGFGPTVLTLDFVDPVAFVSFGLFDPNLQGLTVQAFDEFGTLLETQTTGQEIGIGGTGGVFSTPVTFTQQTDLISSIVIDSVTVNDPIGIDSIFYQTASTPSVFASGPTVVFDDPDLGDVHSVEIFSFGFLDGPTLIGLDANDVLDISISSPTDTLPGQVFLDVNPDANFFAGFAEGDEVALQGIIEISDGFGGTDSASFSIQVINDDGVNQVPTVVLVESTLDASVTVDQVDLSRPSGVFDFDDLSVGSPGPVGDSFVTIRTFFGDGTVQPSDALEPLKPVSSGNVFGQVLDSVIIEFEEAVDSVGFGIELSQGGDATIQIFGPGDVLLEALIFSDLDVTTGASGDDTARAYFSRDDADILRVEVNPEDGTTVSVDEIRYGFGPLLRLEGFAIFQDDDGVVGQDAFSALPGTFSGDLAQLDLSPIGFENSVFNPIDASSPTIATRDVSFSIENNLFGFLGEGEEAEAILPTFYNDDAGQQVQADFTFTFVGVNDAPLAVPDFAVTDEDTSITINITSNDIDLENDILSISQIDGQFVSDAGNVLSSGATISLNGVGAITYDPTTSSTLELLETNQSFTDTFEIVIADPGGLTSTATVEVTVDGVTDISSTSVTLFNQFDPPESGSLYALATSPDGAEIATITEDRATIEFFTPQGDFLRAIAKPGETGNQGDLDFYAEDAPLGGTTVPAGSLLVMSGDVGAADLAAIDPVTGDVLASLPTDFGNANIVGAAYNPVTQSYFLLACNCDSVASNLIAEINPVTGQTLRTIDLDPLGFQTFLGDIDVDPVSGDLFVVSDAEDTRVFRLTTDGEAVEDFTLPTNVLDLSGISVVSGDPAEFVVGSTSGAISRVIEGAVPINFAPVAQNDVATTTESLPVDINAGLNDVDPNGDALTFTLVTTQGDGAPDALLDFDLTDTSTQDPADLLDRNFATGVSLAPGDSVTVAFLDEAIFDGIGNELQVLVNAFNATLAVEGSSDGDVFASLGTLSFSNSVTASRSVDLAAFDFNDRLFAVRLTNESAGSIDLDGIVADGNFSTLQGSVSQVSPGLFQYNPNGAFSALNTGETGVDGFTYIVEDTQGEVDYATVTVTIEGESDSAVSVVARNDGGNFPGFAISNDEQDYAGLSVSRLGDVNGDGFDDVIVGAPLDNAYVTPNSGAAFVIFGGPDVSFTVPATLDGTNGIKVIDSSGGLTGFEVSDAGDFNGDGIDDFYVASITETLGLATGVGHIVFGTDSGFPAELDLADLGAGGVEITAGSLSGTLLGLRAASAGDVNGDGIDDMILDGFTPTATEALDGPFVIFGSTTPAQTIDVTQLDGSDGFRFQTSTEALGGLTSVAGVGDINGDGFDDIGFSRTILPAVAYASPYSITGVFFGTDQGIPAVVDGSNANGLSITGPLDIGLGRAIANGGDINGDGIDDLVVGSPGYSIGVDLNDAPIYGGAVFVLFGGSNLGVNGGITSVNTSDFDGTIGFVVGTTYGEIQLGYSVEIVGDVSGDGVDDLLIGAPAGGTYNSDAGAGNGEAILIFGRDTSSEGEFDALIDTASLTSLEGLRFDGTDLYSRSGYSVSGGMDLNGDGLADIIIGGPSYADTGSYSYFESSESIVIFGDPFLSDLDQNDDAFVDGEEIDAALAAQALLSTDAFTSLQISAGFLLDNDFDPDLDAFDIVSVDTVSLGGAAISFDGVNVLYDPTNAGFEIDPGETEIDLFTYSIEDATGATDTATVTVLITEATAQVFTANPDFFTLAEGEDRDFLQEEFTDNDFDPAGGLLSVVNVELTSSLGASVSLGSGSVLYEQNGVFESLAADETIVDTFDYTLASGQQTTTGTVSLTITGENDAPDTTSSNETTDEDTLLSISIDGLVLSAFDVDGDALFFAGFEAQSSLGVPISADETTLFYDPRGLFDDLASGDEAFDNITYSIRDENNEVVQGIIDVTIEGLNDPVVANDDIGIVPVGAALSSIAIDIDTQVVSIGDLNNDGIDDFAVGLPGDDTNAINSGAVAVVFGNANGLPPAIDLDLLDGTNGFVARGNGTNFAAGFSVDAAGDVNGDGIADLIIGAPQASAGAGQAFVLFGSGDDFDRSVDLVSLDGSEGFVITGAPSGAYSGAGVAGLGDVNGDGVDDILVSMSNSGLIASNNEENYIIYGDANGFGAFFDVGDLDGTNGFTVTGSASYGRSGYSAAALGDVNGDGLNDFALGAPGFAQQPPGDVFIVFGRDADFPSSLDLDTVNTPPATQGFRIGGVYNFDEVGTAIDGVGDFNGDGINDIIIGNYGADFGGPPATNRGEAFIIFGTTTPDNFSLGDISSIAGFQITGIDPGDSAGISVAGVGDVNGDGLGDVLIGASFADPGGYSEGETYLLFGTDDTITNSVFDLSDIDGTNGFIFTGSGSGTRSGETLGAAGDVNNDGFDDFVIVNNLTQSAELIFGSDNLAQLDPDGDGIIDLGTLGAGLGLTTAENTPLSFAVTDVFRNDVDPDDGAVLNLAAFDTVSAEGASVGVSLGSFTYDPGAIFDGLSEGETATDTFSYTVNEGQTSSSATVTIQIIGENDAPVDARASTDFPAFQSDEVSPQFFNLLDGFSDPEGTTLSAEGISVLSSNTNRNVVFFESGGLVEVDPLQFSDIAAGQTEVLTVSWQVADEPGLTTTASAQVTITGVGGNNDVLAVDDAPQPGSGFVIQGILEADYAGDAISLLGDVNGDGIQDILIGAPIGQTPGIGQTGFAYIVFGQSSAQDDPFSLSGASGASGLTIRGSGTNSAFGYSVSGAGDFNGDGIDDFLVGAPEQGITGEGYGYLIFGSDTGFTEPFDISALDGTDGFAINGAGSFDGLGADVAGGGDFNNDGLADIVISTPNRDQVFVIFGANSGFDSTFGIADILGTNGATFSGPDGSQFGASVDLAGDINGDGIDDLIVSAPNEAGTGEVYVIFGRAATGQSDLNVGDALNSNLDGANGFRIIGAQVGSQFGFEVAGLGDFNGDGFQDVLIGTSTDGGDTGAFVVFGFDDDSITSIDLGSDLDGSNGFQITKVGGDYAGTSIANAGDINGDSVDDIVVGAPGANSSTGQSFVIFGRNGGGFDETFELSTITSTTGLVFNGADDFDYSGTQVAGFADVNGDDISDILISATGGDLGSAEYAGEVYVVFGGADSISLADGDGDGVINLGDLQPEGVPDLTTLNSDVLQISVADLLANDIDPGVGEPISIINFDDQTTLGVQLEFNTVTQVFDYDPSSVLVGLPEGQTVTDTFTYTISDLGTQSTATVSIEVTGAPLGVNNFVVNNVVLPPCLPLPFELADIDVPAPEDVLQGSDDFGTPTPIFAENAGIRSAELSVSTGLSELAVPAEVFTTTFSIGPFEFEYQSAFTGDEMTEVYRSTSSIPIDIEGFLFDSFNLLMLLEQMTDGDDDIEATVQDDDLMADLQGNDVLRGLFGDDVYVVVAGPGSVEIDDGAAGGTDLVRLTGTNLADALFTRGPGFSDDLIISDSNGLEVVIRDTLSDNLVGGIEQIEFIDQSLSMADIRETLLDQASTDGDDQIFGFATDDQINAGSGDDILSGGFGDDTFIFEIGGDTDIIVEHESVQGDTDTVQFVGRDFADATFMLIDPAFDAVEIGFLNGDRVVVSGALGPTATVERFEFEDRTVLASELDGLL